MKSVNARIIVNEHGDQRYGLLIEIFHPGLTGVENAEYHSIDIKEFSLNPHLT